MTPTPTPSDLLALSIEQRARDLFAAEYERDGIEFLPGEIRKPGSMLTMFEDRSIRAIKAALTEAARPSLSAQAVGDGWISFADQWPNESPALDDPSVRTTDTVLVTNNLEGRDRMGRMSHVWLASPIDMGTGPICAYTDGNQKIHGLTHWKLPGTTPPQPADGGDRVATLIELLTKYQGEYDTPCPDLTLRHRYRADVFAALAKFQPAGGENDGH